MNPHSTTTPTDPDYQPAEDSDAYRALIAVNLAADQTDPDTTGW